MTHDVNIYDTLSVSNQQKVDMKIYVSEYYRIKYDQTYHDGRDEYIGRPRQMVHYLREAYARDITSNLPPVFADWSMIDNKMTPHVLGMLDEMMPGRQSSLSMVQHLQLRKLVNELTNLPYSERQTAMDRDR